MVHHIWVWFSSLHEHGGISSNRISENERVDTLCMNEACDRINYFNFWKNWPEVSQDCHRLLHRHSYQTLVILLSYFMHNECCCNVRILHEQLLVQGLLLFPELFCRWLFSWYLTLFQYGCFIQHTYIHRRVFRLYQNGTVCISHLVSEDRNGQCADVSWWWYDYLFRFLKFSEWQHCF